MGTATGMQYRPMELRNRHGQRATPSTAAYRWLSARAQYAPGDARLSQQFPPTSPEWSQSRIFDFFPASGAFRNSINGVMPLKAFTSSPKNFFSVAASAGSVTDARNCL